MTLKAHTYKVQPINVWEARLIFYRPQSHYYRGISFDGSNWYTFKKENIIPQWWIKKFDYIIEHTDNTLIECMGYYDKDEKILRFFYDRKINKQYKVVILYQKLERKNQTFLISDDERRKRQIMSIKDLQGIKSGRVDLADAPDVLTPIRVDSEIRKDSDKVECLYVDFYWMEGEDELTLTNKFRPFHVKVLLERMKALKIKNIQNYINQRWTLETEPFDGLGYGKYLPALPIEE